MHHRRAKIHLIVTFFTFQLVFFVSWKQLSQLLTFCAPTTYVAKQNQSFKPPVQLQVVALPIHSNGSSADPYEQYVDGVVARAFPPWPEDLPIPCGQANPATCWKPEVTRAPTKVGILFAKEMKTGSSTVSGVVLRIARNIAKRKNQSFMCNCRFDHFPAKEMRFIDRNPNKSFLFTVIRNPQTRLTSQFFHFHVSRNKVEPSDENFEDYITSNMYMHDYYLIDLGLIPSDVKNLRTLHRETNHTELDTQSIRTLRLKLANDIMRGYDFIGITERMDESLVVLMMMLRLQISDILYIKAKSSGGFDDGAFNSTCTYIVPSFTSPGMTKFFQSSKYFNLSEGDWMLYRAAQKSFDMTIDRLGRQQFERNMLHFRAAQQKANAICAQGIRYPCSPGGVRAPYRKHHDPATDCLWLDSGCGYECLDQIEPKIERMIETGNI